MIIVVGSLERLSNLLFARTREETFGFGKETVMCWAVMGVFSCSFDMGCEETETNACR